MKTDRLILDSSAWIELMRAGSLSKTIEKQIQSATKILIPSIIYYEVYKKISQHVDIINTLSTMTLLNQYDVIDLTRDVSLLAADLSMQYSLSMADAIILAHTYYSKTTLITLDYDFHNISQVKILRK